MRLASATLAAFIVLLSLASLPLASQQAPHGAYNGAPDGTSGIAEAAQARLVHGRLAGLDPATQTLLVIGPTIPYGAAEAANVRSFLEAGGRVLVADAQGTGVDLLRALDVGVSLEGVPIYTPVFLDDSASPIVFSTGRIAGMPDELILRRPTAVTGSGDVVLATHDVSWLDLDGNGRPGLDEPRDAHAFAMVRQVGRGELLVVGSPQVFDNAGHPLTGALLSWAADGREVVLDEGHRRAVDPLQVGTLLAGQAAWAAWLLPAAAGLAALRVTRLRVVRQTPRRLRARPAPATVIEELDP